jgi:protoheme IX farnesyltransferase
MIKEYYRLAKPGIIYGNGITTIAALMYAAQWKTKLVPFLSLFVPSLLGISLVIGSACVFNNYFDRDIDARMERTKKRALVVGSIKTVNALRFGAALGFIGFAILVAFVNTLTAGIALVGFISYVVLYTRMKRRSEWAAVVGTIPGAVPIVVGYTAVMGTLDMTALLLFLILVFWQLPHFYSIALFRHEEYVAARIPVLSAKKGVLVTKYHILFSAAAYLIVLTLFFLLGLGGFAFISITGSFGTAWLIKSGKGFSASDDVAWARNLFRFSLIVLLTFCIALAIDPVLP